MLSAVLRRCEFIQTKPYRGNGEVAIATLGCLLWFIGILIRQSLPEAGIWTISEKLIEAFSFVGFAAIPIFFLATIPGSHFAKIILLSKQGLGFQAMLCLGLAVYLILCQSLSLNPQHFSWISQLKNLVGSNQPQFNSLLFLGSVFVAARIPFLMLEWRCNSLQERLYQRTDFSIFALLKILNRYGQLVFCLTLNTLYLLAVHTSLIPGHQVPNPWEGFWVSLAYWGVCGAMIIFQRKTPARTHLTAFDLGLIILCIGILYWFSIPSFHFGVFIGVDLFILVLIYGTNLGREHFGYSFQIRALDIRVLIQQVIITVLILIPLAVLSGFVQPQLAASQLDVWKLMSYFLLFSFRVGIFEEVFFRCGLMVWLRDQLQHVWGNRLSDQSLLLFSALIGSVLFGLTHLGNEPGIGSPLSPWQYKLVYVGLGSVASMSYSLAFGETNRLSSPIVIHGFVDTTAVVLLGGFLAVPF